MVERPSWRDQLLPWLVVLAGGALGASARWCVSWAYDSSGVRLVWATLSVNLLGCLLMGVLVSYVLAHPARHPLWRPFLGVGFLGGFTTFSAFAADAVALIRDSSWILSAAYLVASVAGCLLAVWAGSAIGRSFYRAHQERRRRPSP